MNDSTASLPSLPPLMTPTTSRSREEAPHTNSEDNDIAAAAPAYHHLLWTLLFGVLLLFSCAPLDGGLFTSGGGLPNIPLWNLSSFVPASHASPKDFKPRFLPSFAVENDAAPMLSLPSLSISTESTFAPARAIGGPSNSTSTVVALRPPSHNNPMKVLMSRTAVGATAFLLQTARFLRHAGSFCRKALRRMRPAMLFGTLGGLVLQPFAVQQMGAVSQAVGGVGLLVVVAWYLPLILVGLALAMDGSYERKKMVGEEKKTSSVGSDFGRRKGPFHWFGIKKQISSI